MNDIFDLFERAGEQDMDFGGNGQVLFPDGSAMEACATYPVTKKIIGAFGFGGGFKLFRLHADGSLDREFGNQGVAPGAFGNGAGRHTPTGLSITSEGRIVVTGTVVASDLSTMLPAIAAFKDNGQADTQFAQGGSLVVPLPAGQADTQVAETGSLVVPLPDTSAQPISESAAPSASAAQTSAGGYVFSFRGNGFYADRGVLVRVTAEGRLDVTFAGVGYSVFQLNDEATRINALLVQTSEQIVVAGAVGGSTGVLARFSSNGYLDTSFAENGLRLYTTRGFAELMGVAARADGRLVAVGYASIYQYGLVVGTSKDGDIDRDFNAGVPLQLQADILPTSFHAVAIKLDGLLVIAGNTRRESATVFRLKPNGDPDTDFTSLSYISGLDFKMTTMVVQSDSDILVGGALGAKPVLKRYFGRNLVAQTTAEQDMNFGQNGQVLFPEGFTIEACTTDPASKKITGAFAIQDGFRLFRLHADGTFDCSFGTDGMSTGKFGDAIGGHIPTAVSIVEDGRVLVTGMVMASDLSSLQPAVAAFKVNGDPDTDFGHAGSLVVPLPETSAQPLGESAQASVGPAHVSASGYLFSFNGIGAYANKGVLVRVTRDGALDSSFAGEGYRAYQLGDGATRINALLIQTGGHIVTAGSIDQQAALARFTGEGELDEQFAENGLKRYPQLESSALTSLTARAHGRLVAVGHSGDYAYGLVVATSDRGADDPGFNDGKPLELQAGLLPTSFRTVAVKLDDLVVIAGNTEQRAATVFRLKPDGSPDPAFAREGYIYGLDFRMTTMALQDDSNILLGGDLLGSDQVSRPVLKRYLGNEPEADWDDIPYAGEQDISFGENGQVVFGKGSTVEVLAIDPATQKIIGAFSVPEGFQLFRLHADGCLDLGFGSGGVYIGTFDKVIGRHTPTGLSILPGGRILVTGTVEFKVSGAVQPAVAAFQDNGEPDTQFGNAGSVVVSLPYKPERPHKPGLPLSKSAEPSAGAAQSSGGGYLFSFNGTGGYAEDGVLVRVTSDGELDKSFAGVGYSVFRFDELPTRINALLVQPGGQIVVAGVMFPMGVLARFTSSGALDLSFADNGLRSYAPLGFAGLTGLASRADGRLVAVGYSGLHESGLVVATLKDGAIDYNFNEGIALRLQADDLPTSFQAVAVKLDDLIVIAGNTEQRAGTVFRLSRNGTPDTAFTPQGYISGLDIRMTTMALQDDSNILLGGALASGPVLKRYVGSDPVAKTAPSQ